MTARLGQLNDTKQELDGSTQGQLSGTNHQTHQFHVAWSSLTNFGQNIRYDRGSNLHNFDTNFS